MAGFGIGNIIGGIGGLVSGLLPGGPTVTNQNQTTNTGQETNTNASSNQSFSQFLTNLLNSIQSSSGGTTSTSSTTPNLSPATQSLLDNLISKYQTLTAPSLTGYAAQQTQGINRSSDLQSQAVQNIMASRGLASSPAAGTAAANIEANRFGQINQMEAGIPLLQNQQNLQNLNAAASFMNMIPKGSTTTGGTTNTQDTTSTQNQSQNTGGQSFANQWGYSGSQGSQNTAGTSSTQQKGSTSAGLAGLLAGLFSDVRLKKEVEQIPTAKAAARILALHPVTWKWKGGEEEDTGLLAQDIKQYLPELVKEDPSSGYLKVNYAGLISEIVGTLQHLDNKLAEVSN